MPQLIIISRVSDGLLLAEDMKPDPVVANLRSQAIQVLAKVTERSADKMSLDAGKFYFLYLIANGVCLLTIAENSYPKKLAFAFLTEVEKEFQSSYGPQVKTVTRPFPFMEFDGFIQNAKRVYMDTKSKRNLEKVSQDLGDIHQIMSKNVQDIIQRGEKLEALSDLSDQLSSQSKLFEKKATDLNKCFWLKQYAPFIAFFSLLFFFLFLRLYLF